MKDADVVHLHSSKAGFLGRLACRMLGMQDRVVYSPHGVSFIRKDISGMKVTLFTFLEKTGARLGGWVVGSCASEVAAFAAVGISAKHINNGVACEGNYSPARRNHAPVVIGTAARITHQKNPGLFVAVAQAFVADPSVRFLWIGDGELRHLLSSPNIEITGWLPGDALRQKLHELDIYLSTSLWEGMPLTVLSAMCAGKPLLLHDCVGNRDLVREGINGFLFVHAAEAVKLVQQLSSNRTSLAKMGQASHELATNEFSLAKTVEGYRTLYRQISA
jgi:glycosyltransferase involved in cell wall biosynthesis